MTVNGQIRSEHRSGEAKARDFIHDALGNVVAVFQNDWQVGEAAYDPSGEFLGNWQMSSYKFAWNGGHGYRSTGLEWSTHYVRARHYAFMDQAWTTVDLLWPQEMPYGYVNGMVMSAVDYFGMQSTPPLPTTTKGGREPSSPCNSSTRPRNLYRLLGLHGYTKEPVMGATCGSFTVSISHTGTISITAGGGIPLGIPGITGTVGIGASYGFTATKGMTCNCNIFITKVSFRYERWGSGSV